MMWLLDQVRCLQQHHQRDARIAPVQIAVLAKKGKTVEKMADLAAGTPEVLAADALADAAAMLEVEQAGADFLPDQAARAAGTVAVDEGQHTPPF